MKYYEAPTAKKVEFEPVNILLMSDMPEILEVWGSMIRNINSGDIDLYK